MGCGTLGRESVHFGSAMCSKETRQGRWEGPAARSAAAGRESSVRRRAPGRRGRGARRRQYRREARARCALRPAPAHLALRKVSATATWPTPARPPSAASSTPVSAPPPPPPRA
ncbi:hypothetical protein EVAR_97353_1 [Eumeta japonica]|uniref:Uncharacterized protein n=1 Tax=Eumeta variegata TaxID=151549 RepID=A0A4C1YZW7_EUMVA|nr:hypothetical protein EVAR_97353_1 [Eumeta japonica]